MCIVLDVLLQAGSEGASGVVIYVKAKKCEEALSGNYQCRTSDDHGAAGAGDAGVNRGEPVPASENKPCNHQEGAEQQLKRRWIKAFKK